MTDLEKKQAIINKAEELIWSEAERVGIENNDKHLVQGIRLTRLRMKNQPNARKTLQYFWSAIQGTERSRNFYNIMKRYNLTTFEDIIVEFRDTFTDEWLAN